MRKRWWAGPSIAAAVVVLAACGSTSAGNSGGSSGSGNAASSGGGTAEVSGSGSGIKAMSTSKGTVLATSTGRTVYWFVIDTPGKSNCNGQCATFWPPVPFSAKPASSSLPGKFGKVTRADGSKQLSYDGRPLYTFKQDTAAGQVNGNGINTSGGLWYAETPNGTKLAAKTGGSGGSSGGYGY
jgi:predicted lipoprotein with Yx(FWY)xxD motif